MSAPENNDDSLPLGVSRRGFLKASSAAVALPFLFNQRANATGSDAGTVINEVHAAERVVQTCSTFDCGGKCDIRAHIADGVGPKLPRVRTAHLIRKCR